MSDFKVMAPSINVQTKNLSGGNIQKLILGREISENPSLLVASHPTYENSVYHWDQEAKPAGWLSTGAVTHMGTEHFPPLLKKHGIGYCVA